MPNSTRTNYTAAEVNSGMQNGFVGFMNANKGKTANDVMQEMMGALPIRQEHLNMAQAMAKRFEAQFSGLRNMFNF